MGKDELLKSPDRNDSHQQGAPRVKNAGRLIEFLFFTPVLFLVRLMSNPTSMCFNEGK